MIKNFSSKLAKDVYDGEKTRYARQLPVAYHSKAQRLLDQINAATVIETLNVPPSNRLKKLSGHYRDYWRIKITKQ